MSGAIPQLPQYVFMAWNLIKRGYVLMSWLLVKHRKLGYGLDNRGSRVRFPAGGLGIFLFTALSRTALWPTEPPIQWVAGALSLRGKVAGT
jgi:hypothetical protein